MATAIDVARYLVRLATPVNDEDSDCLSPMRLQKLLYYAQGWYIAATGKPLFAGRIDAWIHGPVVREVYGVFKEYQRAIPAEAGAESESLTSREKVFIRAVWEEYGSFSTTALRGMTHKESPWLDARGDLPPNAPSQNEISHSSLAAFFTPLLKAKQATSDPGIRPKSWEKATAAIAAGQVQTVEEIRREIRRHRTGSNPG